VGCMAPTTHEAQNSLLLLNRRGDSTLEITLKEHRLPSRDELLGIVDKMRCGASTVADSSWGRDCASCRSARSRINVLDVDHTFFLSLYWPSIMSHADVKLLKTFSRNFRSASRPQYRRCRYNQRRNAATKAPGPKSADDPNFVSIVDAPPKLVSTKKRTSKLGYATLALIPFTAFCLGSWQVQRLDWKTKLIAKFEDRLVRPPLPLPPRVDPDAVAEFDYRRVYATGKLRHDQEMLIGPRMHDGQDGFQVVTPLEREGASTILVNRGWISRDKQDQRLRDPLALPTEEVTISGLLREPVKKNMFTPKNKPEEGKFFFPDVFQMAAIAGCEPIWVEETMQPSLLEAYDREDKGRPIGRPAAVNLRNNHAQYIFTW
jgi:surfeit locus 1 family protein